MVTAHNVFVVELSVDDPVDSVENHHLQTRLASLPRIDGLIGSRQQVLQGHPFLASLLSVG